MKKKIIYFAIILIITCVNSKLLAQEQIITISAKINDDNSVDFNYEKTNPGSYSVEIKFSSLSNCEISDLKKVIKDNIGFLVKLKPINKEQGIGYAMNYFTMQGEINPKIDSLFHYTLPFKNGKRVKFYEAYNAGEKYLGQEKDTTWKSYYTQSESPDTIYSMRKGIVIALINEYDSNSSIDKQYTTKRNSIVIEHADGTHASYKGFKKNSMSVKLGQTVYPQTKLGLTEIFDNDKYKIDISIYYLSDPDFKQKNKTLENYKGKYKFVTPIFVTSEGDFKIQPNTEYIVSANEINIQQEFSKSEKKKYMTIRKAD